jgi:peptidoglycan hydrolase-like protein with peptidoglycan-binding domain
MEMRCEILEEDQDLKGVVKVRVPGIYGVKGNSLPDRMAKLVKSAAMALQKVYADITNEGGHLFISDMFRSAEEQQKAHEDWQSGRKSDFSPPSCNSVHEAARAIDIDAFDTGIGHRRVREILNKHGWVNIVETLTGSECWHYEFREDRWETYKVQNGYSAMARAMKQEIGNVAGLDQAISREEEVKWLQESLNKILGLQLQTDGIYGKNTRESVRKFQEDNGLQIDGVAGPITKKKIHELLGYA